jgi:hypothetical protein
MKFTKSDGQLVHINSRELQSLGTDQPTLAVKIFSDRLARYFARQNRPRSFRQADKWIFGAGVVECAADRERIRELHAKIGVSLCDQIAWDHLRNGRRSPTRIGDRECPADGRDFKGAADIG